MPMCSKYCVTRKNKAFRGFWRLVANKNRRMEVVPKLPLSDTDWPSGAVPISAGFKDYDALI